MRLGQDTKRLPPLVQRQPSAGAQRDRAGAAAAMIDRDGGEQRLHRHGRKQPVKRLCAGKADAPGLWRRADIVAALGFAFDQGQHDAGGRGGGERQAQHGPVTGGLLAHAGGGISAERRDHLVREIGEPAGVGEEWRQPRDGPDRIVHCGGMCDGLLQPPLSEVGLEEHRRRPIRDW